MKFKKERPCPSLYRTYIHTYAEKKTLQAQYLLLHTLVTLDARHNTKMLGKEQLCIDFILQTFRIDIKGIFILLKLVTTPCVVFYDELYGISFKKKVRFA